jgi:hypothetical protein
VIVSTYLLVIPACAVVAMAAWTWALHLRQQARIEALEGRVANLLAGLSLLTDTTESGLRDVTAEVARLSGSGSRPRTRTSTHRRIAGAAKRGETVQAIAAAEQISEGEVKLRLSMNGAQEGSHAEMR